MSVYWTIKKLASFMYNLKLNKCCLRAIFVFSDFIIKYIFDVYGTAGGFDTRVSQCAQFIGHFVVFISYGKWAVGG